MSFADHVCDFDAVQCCRGRNEGLEPLHLPGQFFDEPVLLLDYVVQILDLQHFDQPNPTVQQQQAIHVL